MQFHSFADEIAEVISQLDINKGSVGFPIKVNTLIFILYWEDVLKYVYLYCRITYGFSLCNAKV